MNKKMNEDVELKYEDLLMIKSALLVDQIDYYKVGYQSKDALSKKHLRERGDRIRKTRLKIKKINCID